MNLMSMSMGVVLVCCCCWSALSSCFGSDLRSSFVAETFLDLLLFFYCDMLLKESLNCSFVEGVTNEEGVTIIMGDGVVFCLS